MRTEQQRAGDAAEDLVAARLEASGWRVLARRLRVGREEVDLVAVDPGPPPWLVIVEVRWRRERDFGLPEDTLDWRKRRHLRRALAGLIERGLPGAQAPAFRVRVDLIAVEPPSADGQPRIRHHRHVLGS
jgi:putative endonuclease